MITQMTQAYFIFEKVQGKIAKLSGPLCEEEIDTEIDINYKDSAGYEVLPEDIFSMLYHEEYVADKKVMWIDYLALMLEEINLIKDYSIDAVDDSIESETFCAFIASNGKLTINFSLLLDPTVSAILALEIQKRLGDVLEIQVNPPFYITSKKEVCMSENAYAKHLAESAIPRLN